MDYNVSIAHQHTSGVIYIPLKDIGRDEYFSFTTLMVKAMSNKLPEYTKVKQFYTISE